MSRQRAFSLLELFAVVIILAILSVYAIPRFTHSANDARQSANQHNKSLINSTVERYTAEVGQQPDTIDDLDHPDYFPDGLPANPVSGLPYALDPVTKRVVD